MKLKYVMNYMVKLLVITTLLFTLNTFTAFAELAPQTQQRLITDAESAAYYFSVINKSADLDTTANLIHVASTTEETYHGTASMKLGLDFSTRNVTPTTTTMFNFMTASKTYYTGAFTLRIKSADFKQIRLKVLDAEGENYAKNFILSNADLNGWYTVEAVDNWWVGIAPTGVTNGNKVLDFPIKVGLDLRAYDLKDYKAATALTGTYMLYMDYITSDVIPYTVDNVTFKKNNGQISLIESGEITTSSSIINRYYSSGMPVTYIVALFNNNNLEGVSYTTDIIGLDEAKPISESITVPDLTGNNYSVRVFVWDGFMNQKPLYITGTNGGPGVLDAGNN